MEYILLCVAGVLLILSYSFKKKYQKLIPTGRVPDAITASRRSALSLFFAICTVLLFIVLKKFN